MSEAVSTSPASAPSPEPDLGGEHRADRPCRASPGSGRPCWRPRPGARCRARRPTTRRSARPGPSRRRWCRRSTRPGSTRRSRSRRRGSGWSRRASGRPAGRRRRPRRAASATGVGSGCWATVLRAVSMATSQFSGPSYGCIIDWSWLKSWPRSGAPPPKNCSNGVPRNGLAPFGSSSGGGSLVMAPRYAVGGRRSRAFADRGRGLPGRRMA